MNQEVEVKLALADPADLDRLLSGLPAALEIVDQANHYYGDAAGLLGRDRIMVRIREERTDTGEARFLATVKRRTARSGGVFASEEREALIEPGVWRGVVEGHLAVEDLEAPPLVWLRTAFPGLGPLLLVGTAANTRHRVRWGAWVLEVDRTRFPDGFIDAEVEVETAEPEAALQAVGQLLDAHGIRWMPQTAGKYRRFMAHRGNLAR
jgi:uncharacterized protein YjbK